MRSAENELQNTIELCAAASEIAAPTQISATVEDVKTKLSCEISLKIWNWQMWKRSFRARRPSNPDSWRCENEAFPQLKMWNRSFRARPPSKSASGRYEDKACVRDFLQILKLQVVKMTPELSVPLRGRSDHDPRTTETVSHPSAGQASPHIFRDTFCPAKHSISCILSKTHFVRDFPQKVKVEDVKTKLSCESSLKKWKLKMWNRSFRARPPSKSASGRYEDKACVRDFLQILKLQVVKMTPELSVPLRGRSDHDPRTTETVSHPSAGQASPHIFRDTFCPAKHSISCILSKTHFVRDFPQKVKVEDVKTKLSCESSLKKWKLKTWKQSFHVKTKLSCETSLQIFVTSIALWQPLLGDIHYFVTSVALWQPLLCDIHCLILPSKGESWRCENEAFVRDFPPNLCDIHCSVTAIALWHPLLCDTHCSVTAVALWHPLPCNIHCFVTSIAPWQPLHIHCHP